MTIKTIGERVFGSSQARKRMYEHMEGAKMPVLEVDPLTGEYIETKAVDKRLVINHHLKRDKNPIEPLSTYKAKGVTNMTQKEVDIAYKIIKGFKNAEQYC